MEQQIKKDISLYGYQQDIIDWMINVKSNPINGSRGGILYVEMGLGKTFTTLEYLRQTQSKKSLVICSKTLIQEWLKQIDKFYVVKPKVFVYHTSFNSLKNLKYTDLQDYDIIITTYHMISKSNKLRKDFKLSDNLIFKEEIYGKFKWKIANYEELNFNIETGKNILYGMKWDNIICDESQTITNWKTSFFQSIYTLNTKFIFGLSGTPIKNNKSEFITSLKMLKVNGNNYPSLWNKSENIMNPEYFNLFYNVDYEKANVKLPEIKNIIKELEFSPLEKQILERYVGLWEGYLGTTTDKYDDIMTKLLGLFTRLRQINLDKMLLVSTKSGLRQYIESIIYQEQGTDPNDIEITEEQISNFNHNLTFGNQKFEEIKKIIEEVKQRNEKILIFSSFTKYLELLSGELGDENITFIQSIDSIQTRQMKINMWKENEDKRIMIMNYRIGAEGLNLVEANNVMLLDTWWNFTYEKQAIARCHRIGQTKSVNVYRLLFKNSVETLMFNKSAFKSDIFNKIKNNENLKHEQSELSLRNMNEIIRSIKTGLRTIELDLSVLEGNIVVDDDINELGDMMDNMNLNNDNNEDDNNDDECPICYENIKNHEKITTKCNHNYHINCLNDWKMIKNDCPTCRKHL